jgi:hypothetical protein
VQLARSVVEATAKDKGITQGLLIKKIEQVHSGGFIREYVKDAPTKFATSAMTWFMVILSFRSQAKKPILCLRL